MLPIGFTLVQSIVTVLWEVLPVVARRGQIVHIRVQVVQTRSDRSGYARSERFGIGGLSCELLAPPESSLDHDSLQREGLAVQNIDLGHGRAAAVRQGYENSLMQSRP